MHKNTKATAANVEKVSRELAYRINSLSWPEHFTTLVEMCREEEKGHRGFGARFGANHPHAPALAISARYWAVHRIGESLNGRAAPGGSDFLHCQKSIFQAAAIVSEYGDLCREALAAAGVSAEYLAGLDYAAWVSPEEVAA
jgi:hypothetical protein